MTIKRGVITGVIGAAILLVVSVSAVATGSAETEAGGDGAEVAMEISWLSIYPPQTDTTPVQLWLEEEFNIKIKNMRIDRANWDEQLNVRLAAGDIPDMFLLNNYRRLPQYVEQGVLAEMPMEMIRRYVPRYAARVDEANPSLWLDCVYEGKNYGIPNFWPDGETPNVPAYNGDWMRAVGVSDPPETLAELEELFTRFTYDDPDGNGRDDTYGTSARGKDGLTAAFQQVFGAFGTMPLIWTENEDGQIEFGMTGERARAAFRVLNRWYEDGLIDPEFIVANDALIIQKFTGGVIGSTDANMWYHLESSGKLGRVFQENGVELVVGKPVTGPDGASGGFTGGGGGWVQAAGIQAEEDEARMIKILQIIEALASDEETWLMVTYGEEGVHYEMVDGQPRPFPDYVQDITRGELIGAGNFYSPFIDASVFSEKYLYTPTQIAFRNEAVTGVNRIKNVATFIIPSALDYPDLGKLQNEYFIKFVTGEVDLDGGFDDFVTLWLNSGGRVLTQEVNEINASR